MPQPLIEQLRAELGAGAPPLPAALEQTPEPALRGFLDAVRHARAQQAQALQDSAEASLRLVPALLRPVVRKVLFG